jgi:glycosyltransferase involved in cell wall biosynthesis
MNILFVHEINWLTKVVFEPHTYSELLSKRGHKVFAIDFESDWKNLGIDLKTKRFKKINRSVRGGSIELIRPGSIKLPGLDRISYWFTSMLEIDKIIKRGKIDAIILYSSPTNGIQTLRVAEKYNIPVFFRSLDILHMLVPKKYLRPIVYQTEKYVYKKSDKLLALTPKLVKYLEKMGAEKEKIDILLPAVNIKLFKKLKRNKKLMKLYKIKKSDKVILFMGTLFKFSGMDTFVKKFKRVLKEVSEAKLLVVGGGEIFEEIRDVTNKNNLQDKIIFTGFQPFELMPKFISIADVCINPFELCKETKDIIPTKLFQYLACGKPTVAIETPGTKSVLIGKKQGLVFAKNSDDFVRKVIMLLKNKKMQKSIGNSGYNYVRKNHSYENATKRLENIISNF